MDFCLGLSVVNGTRYCERALKVGSRDYGDWIHSDYRGSLETSAGIRILAIAHDLRKPGYWTSRLK